MEKEMSFTVDINLFKKYLTEPFVVLEPQDSKITLVCKKEEIFVSEKNVQNVLFLLVEFNMNMLENYENNLDDDEELELTILVNDINTALQNMTGKCKFVLNSKKQRLDISSGIYNYGIGLKARTNKRPNFPSLDFENTINFIGEKFHTILEKSSKINNLISLQIKHELLDKNSFLLNITAIKSDTNSDLSVEIDKWNMTKFNIENECSVLLDVLNTSFLDISKVTIKNSQDILLHIRDEYPILITFNIEENKGITKLVLAPRSDK